MQIQISKILIYFFIVANCHAQYDSITERIENIINTHSNLHIGCEIYSLKNQKIVYSKNAQQLFIPASNTKLFSASLAWELLVPIINLRHNY